jgi:hypothetical protein
VTGVQTCALPICNAHAIDGVIEINHAKIMAAGVYPYTISQPGSYRLTGNLTQPNPNTDVIRIHASHVTLDLNGHAILGANTCALSGGAVVCTANGTGRGISSSIAPNEVVDTRIRNGTVSGMGGDCITGPHSPPGQIEDIAVSHCGGRGIVGGYAHVIRCQVMLSIGDGINAYAAAGNLAHVNGGAGIVTSSLARDNVIERNVGVGLSLISPGLAIANIIRYNDGAGIVGGSGFNASENHLISNSDDTLPPTARSTPTNSNLCGNVTC